MDHEPDDRMSADECARQIIQAINANKEEVYIGGKEVKAIWLKRFFPLRLSKYLRTAKVT
ncbi:hypothetical protein D3C85_1587060 [compost metagenome]